MDEITVILIKGVPLPSHLIKLLILDLNLISSKKFHKSVSRRQFSNCL